jgi:hypothetical protein
MVTPQEWLKEKLNEYTGLDEKDIEELVEEYNNEFENNDDLQDLKNKLLTKLNIKDFSGEWETKIDELKSRPSRGELELVREQLKVAENSLKNALSLVSNMDGEEGKNNEIVKVNIELQKCIGEIENLAGKTKSLENEIEKLEKVKESLQENDPNYQSLIDQINKLKKELEENQGELEKSKVKIRNLEEKFVVPHQDIEKKITEKIRNLEGKKKECAEGIKESYSSSAVVEIYIKKLEDLLEAQAEVIKNNSSYAVKEKKKLLDEVSKKNSDKLKPLIEEACKFQIELARLQKDLETIKEAEKRITKVVRDNEVLREVKDRGRSDAIDGVYATLGLLPYKVVASRYREDRKYTKEDARGDLFDVLKVAIENGYGEPSAWHGKGEDVGIGRCWIPDIIDDKGSTSVEGGLDIFRSKFKDIKFTDSDNIELTGKEYKIIDSNLGSNPVRIEEGYKIEGGTYKWNIKVRFVEDEGKETEEEIPVSVFGTEESFDELKKEVKKGSCYLLMIDEWEGSRPFALLVSKKDNHCHRVGLVEIKESDLEKLQQVGKEEKLIIKMDEEQAQIQVARIEENSKVRDLEEELGEMQTQVEVPSKPGSYLQSQQQEERELQAANNIESLSHQIKIRKRKLNELLTDAKNKLSKELEFLLEILPKIQVDIVKKGNNPFTEERFQDLATILEKKIRREEIELICQKKREIVYLEEIIESNRLEKEIKLEAQVEIKTSK